MTAGPGGLRVTARVKFNYHPNNRLDVHKRIVDSIIVQIHYNGFWPAYWPGTDRCTAARVSSSMSDIMFRGSSSVRGLISQRTSTGKPHSYCMNFRGCFQTDIAESQTKKRNRKILRRINPSKYVWDAVPERNFQLTGRATSKIPIDGQFQDASHP